MCRVLYPITTKRFFHNNGLQTLSNWVAANASKAPPIPVNVRLGSPITRPSKIICIGLNYRDHAKETGATPPSEPILFFKSTTAIVGPDDDLVIPHGSEKTDWEVELAFVVGKSVPASEC